MFYKRILFISLGLCFLALIVVGVAVIGVALSGMGGQPLASVAVVTLIGCVCSLIIGIDFFIHRKVSIFEWAGFSLPFLYIGIGVFITTIRWGRGIDTFLDSVLFFIYLLMVFALGVLLIRKISREHNKFLAELSEQKQRSSKSLSL